jgi:hypothetical protein
MDDVVAELELAPDEEAAIASYLLEHFLGVDSERTWQDVLNRWVTVWRWLPSELAEHGYRGSIFDYVEDLRMRTYLDELMVPLPPNTRSKLETLLVPCDEAFFRQVVAGPPILPHSSHLAKWGVYIPRHPGKILHRHLESEYRHNGGLPREGKLEDLLS